MNDTFKVKYKTGGDKMKIGDFLFNLLAVAWSLLFYIMLAKAIKGLAI